VLSTNEVVKTNLVSTNEKKICPQPEPVINRAEMVQDDFVQEDELMQDTINDQNTVGEVDKNEKYSYAAESSSTGFQMPANFDLPDEIIQEQLPAAKVPFHILRKHFYSTKPNLNSLIFFRQNERISFSTLLFDEIFML
jgi:hypothetical protein